MRAIESAQCCKIGFLTWPPVQRLLSSMAALFECRWSRQLGQFSDLKLLNCPPGMIKTAWEATCIFYVLSLRVRLCLQQKHPHLFPTMRAIGLKTHPGPGDFTTLNYHQKPCWVLMSVKFFLDVFSVFSFFSFFLKNRCMRASASPCWDASVLK